SGVIVVDSSALIEIIRAGPRADDCINALAAAEAVRISAGTMVESLIVATGHAAEQPLSDLFDQFGLEVVPVTEERAKLAARAYRRYGKGRHAAALNFGDCFAYALARELDWPLLFVGNDFALTDLKSVLH
ncbi:MAG: type II toxin-antitoxin system VapC family toxin, partial [Pseudomonadota bacterium]|nr:type II toxin-antitoxin system VapC family toxin [Pseudomonadota bacterium]